MSEMATKEICASELRAGMVIPRKKGFDKVRSVEIAPKGHPANVHVVLGGKFDPETQQASGTHLACFERFASVTVNA
jgi:hypothetical protein